MSTSPYRGRRRRRRVCRCRRCRLLEALWWVVGGSAAGALAVAVPIGHFLLWAVS